MIRNRFDQINTLTGYEREPNLLGSLQLFQVLEPNVSNVRVLVGGASPEELVSIQRHCESLGFAEYRIVGLNYNPKEIRRNAGVARECGITPRYSLVRHDLCRPFATDDVFDIALLNNVLGHLFLRDPDSGDPRVEDGSPIPDTNLQQTFILNMLASLKLQGIFSIEVGRGLGYRGDKGSLPGKWARNIATAVAGLNNGKLGCRCISPDEGRQSRVYNERYWQKISSIYSEV